MKSHLEASVLEAECWLQDISTKLAFLAYSFPICETGAGKSLDKIPRPSARERREWHQALKPHVKPLRHSRSTGGRSSSTSLSGRLLET